MACSLARMPLAAISAAITPKLLARPPCNGFAMVPKFSNTPPANEADKARAWHISSSLKPMMAPAATAEPNVPKMAVGCQPLS